MSNKTISIPAIPANWIAHSGVRPAGNGYRTHVKKVLHPVDGYHPFCIHAAYEYNGAWEYENGRYFKNESDALTAFSGE